MMERQSETIYTSRLEAYNVAIAVWEGRQLAGLEIDPFVTLNIGQFTRKTKKRKGTNDPSFHEVLHILVSVSRRRHEFEV